MTKDMKLSELAERVRAAVHDGPRHADDPVFMAAWETLGFQYSESNIDKVHIGWRMATALRDSTDRDAVLEERHDGREFQEGDKVHKASGYRWPGEVVAVFKTRAGKTRVVVECTVPEVAGALHIYSPEQLELERGDSSSRESPRPIREGAMTDKVVVTQADEQAAPAAESDWFAGDVDCDGNELVTIRADELCHRQSAIAELCEGLREARGRFAAIAEFGDPWEIAEEPEEFGGTDDGQETVCMAYENMQSIAGAAAAKLDALLSKHSPDAPGDERHG